MNCFNASILLPQPGFWMWSDGTKFYYENWHHDHDEDDQEKACVKMNYKCKEVHHTNHFFYGRSQSQMNHNNVFVLQTT